MQLHTHVIGNGAPALLLLHGLGVNGAVWQPLIERLQWPGRVVVPDLRGHGRSMHGTHYGYGHHAADCADLLAPSEPVFIVGHSMGGAIGVKLADTSYGIDVRGVLAFGVKAEWSSEELEKAWSLARVPVRWFDTRAEAADRFLRIAGLTGLVSPDHPIVDIGLREEVSRFRLAMDPATFSAPGPEFGALMQAARAPVRMAAGANDKMAPIGQARAHDREAVELADAGHNPHVETPGALTQLVRRTFLD